jgi:site-specific DNA-methyltransferase (adenine-specific)
MLDFGFYNMDCMEGMKQFPDKYFDLAIVDPPYGINVGCSSMGAGGRCTTPEPISCKSAHRAEATRLISHSRARKNRGGGYRTIGGAKPFGSNQSGRGIVYVPKIYKAFDDSHTPDAAYFKELERVAKHRIIWGGNYFLEYLGATECMIVWDKKRRGLNFADCEIAWTDIKQPCRIYEFRWNGMLQENADEKEFRIHPTQKPRRLYKYLLDTFAKPSDTILDTHVGSASSLVACRETGHKYVGFEIDPDYYRMAKERLDAAEAQGNIFDFL